MSAWIHQKFGGLIRTPNNAFWSPSLTVKDPPIPTLSLETAAAPALNPFYAPAAFSAPAFLHNVVDTTQSAFAAQRQLLAVEIPFVTLVLPALLFVPGVTDTSQSAFALQHQAIIADAPFGSPAFQTPARIRDLSDTSQSAFAALRRVVLETPRVPFSFQAPAAVRNVVDTSQSSFALVRTPVVVSVPFLNGFLSAPSAFRYLSDTSLGVAKVLFSDASFSFKNTPHTAPDRVRPVTDTSQSAFLTLQPLAPKPFFNSPFSLLDKFHITPPDTTQQTSLARGIPAPAATISVVQPYITVYFWKRIA